MGFAYLIKAAELLIAISAIQSIESKKGAVETAINIYNKYVSFSEPAPKDIEALVLAVAKGLDEAMNELDFGEDIRLLIPQMIQNAKIRPEDIIEANLDAKSLVELMLSRMTYIEHRTEDSRSQFRLVVTPTLKKLLNTEDFQTKITGAYRNGVLEKLTVLQKSVAEIQATVQDWNGLSEDKLTDIAKEFGHPNPAVLSRIGLIDFIHGKLPLWKDTIDAAQSREKRHGEIEALEASADSAIARRDFEEASAFMSAAIRQSQDQLEGPLKDLEEQFLKRAQISLLQGQVEPARKMLEKAAQIHLPINATVVAKKLVDNAGLLFAYGEDQSGGGLIAAMDLYRKARSMLDNHGDKALSARIANNLGSALSQTGVRNAAEIGGRQLDEAVDMLKQAVDFYEEQGNLKMAARANTNLAVALSNRTEHQTDADVRKADLTYALSAYETALIQFSAISDDPKKPLHIAMTIGNRGSTLVDISRLEAPDRALERLTDALADLTSAREHRRALVDGEGVARMEDALGKAETEVGKHTAGKASQAAFDRAAAHYQDALDELNIEQQSAVRAMVHKNLAALGLARARHKDANNPRMHLVSAQAHIRKALGVYDPHYMAHDVSAATRLLDEINVEIARHGVDASAMEPQNSSKSTS